VPLSLYCTVQYEVACRPFRAAIARKQQAVKKGIVREWKERVGENGLLIVYKISLLGMLLGNAFRLFRAKWQGLQAMRVIRKTSAVFAVAHLQGTQAF